MRNRYLASALILVLGNGTANLLASSSVQLEKELWSTSNEKLHALEDAIIREIQHNPESVHHHYLLTNVYLRHFLNSPIQSKWLDKAIKLARQTIYLDTNSELGYLALADIYDVVGKTEKAKEVFRVFTYRTTIEKSWRYYLIKAKIFLTAEAVDNSLKLLQTALQKEGAPQEIVIPYVIVMLDAKHAGNMQAVVAAVERWRQKIPNPLFDQYIASLHMSNGNYEEARQLYRAMLDKDPFNREARRNWAIIAYRHMQNYEGAQKELLALLDNKENVSQLEISVINLHLGIIYLHRAKQTQARDAFLSAFDITNNDDAMLEFVIAAYKQQKQFHQLASFLEHLNIEKPGNSIYYGILGDVWTEHIGDYRRAASAYKNAIVLDPYNGRLYSALGMAHYRLREFEQALKMFGKARTLDTLDATAFYNEACVYALLSRSEEAVSSLQKAIELDSSLRKHAREDADFDKIRELPAFIDMVN